MKKLIFGVLVALCLISSYDANAFGPAVGFSVGSASSMASVARGVATAAASRSRVIKYADDVFGSYADSFLGGGGGPKCVVYVNYAENSNNVEQVASFDDINMYCD